MPDSLPDEQALSDEVSIASEVALLRKSIHDLEFRMKSEWNLRMAALNEEFDKLRYRVCDLEFDKLRYRVCDLEDGARTVKREMYCG